MQSHRDFLLREFFSMSLQAATQHVKIYAPEVREADRREVRLHLRDVLEKIAHSYTSEVEDAVHTKNIQGIVNTLSRRHAGFLMHGKFPFATAQKSLNLYLKYLWCADLISMPPHCPIDAFVLRAAKLKAAAPWTKMQDVEEYKILIAQLKVAANGMPLAEWELAAYNASDA